MTETENVCLTCGGSGVYEFSRHHPSCTGGDDLTTCLSLCPVLDQEECPDCTPKLDCIDTLEVPDVL